MSDQLNISVLDLAFVNEGSSILQTYQNSVSLAQHTEALGYRRFWLAEHHNAVSIASSATSVLIGYIAGGTKTIRVGSGGIMLPNHSSLVIAEQFGTLESMYPGRIDLGLGRAPGTDGVTAMALGRNLMAPQDPFPKQIAELQTYFSADNATGKVRAIPGEGLDIPMYILGSSTESAWLASRLGLPYAFAGHFAPEQMEQAFHIYSNHYQPSEKFPEPYAIACINVFMADTDDHAQFLATTMYQSFLNLIRNNRTYAAPPVADMDALWSYQEAAVIKQKFSESIIGAPATAKAQLTSFLEKYPVDELMVTANIFNHEERLKSYSLFKELVAQSF